MTEINPAEIANQSRPEGLRQIPVSPVALNRKEYISDQEVRWCPGCGDYAILATFQGMLPKLGIKRENTVIVSGIGCSSRFPYYLNTYGMHSIHGRAPAIATGLAVTRPDLNVWVITGDGDALSIGGNHLIHALRRNVNITILLFNNEIYGLTKGQYSPTSLKGTVTKSTPLGSVDQPFNPLSVALGAEASFVARTVDSNRAHLDEVLTAAVAHRGASFVEILQNCPIFNDGAFDDFKGPEADILPLVANSPVASGNRAVVRNPDGTLAVVELADSYIPGETTEFKTVTGEIVEPIFHHPSTADAASAFALARLNSPLAIGILRDIDRPVYDDEVRKQVKMPKDRNAELQKLLHGSDTWTVE